MKYYWIALAIIAPIWVSVWMDVLHEGQNENSIWTRFYIMLTEN